jgi:small subunit ribosomal protein S1
VKVLDIDRDRQRISLGLKQTQADPWQQVLDAYQQGDVVRGRVTKVVTFGAFVEIVPGVEGLVHISELAAHHVENPREVVTQGDDTPVKIIEVDADRRRLSLSIKRVEPEDEILASIELEGLPPRRDPVVADDDPRYSAEANDIDEIEASLPAGDATDEAEVEPAATEESADANAAPEGEAAAGADAEAETPEEAEAEALAVEEPEVEPEPEAVAEPEVTEEPAEAEAEAEPEVVVEPEAEPEPEAAAETESTPEPEAAAEPEATTDSAPEPEEEAAPEAKPEPELGLSDDVFGDAADGEIQPADERADAPA